MNSMTVKHCLSATIRIVVIALLAVTVAVGLNAQQQNAEAQAPANNGRQYKPSLPIPFSSRWSNADGSKQLAFKIGGVLNQPVGGTHAYYTTGGGLQVGAGHNFNKKLGVMLNFNAAWFGIPGSILNQRLETACWPFVAASSCNVSLNGSRGDIWSFSIDPVYNLVRGENSSVYATGGVGFYHKGTGFQFHSHSSSPGAFNGPDIVTWDTYISNAVGFNAGFGYTHGWFYTEARYVYTANSRRPQSGFPENSAPTTYIPITLGVRY